MIDLDLCTISFNKPALIAEQIRLLDKYLTDDFALTIIDNSSDQAAAHAIAGVVAAQYDLVCDHRLAYERVSVPGFLHNHALNKAAAYLLERGAPYIGFLDHDVVPTCRTSLIEKIDKAGFYGVGQRHSPTDSRYIWPGFFFMSRGWLESKQPRHLNFDGIRGNEKADDGDCGSTNAPLFQDEDWASLYQMSHGYKPIREPDDHGLQSFGVEILGDWLHLSNGSGWKWVPDFAERERLTLEMLAAL